MSVLSPTERISERLQSAGYRRLSAPLEIGGLTFALPAAFVGSGRAADLVLVADTAFEPGLAILRKIEGIGRALDVMRSKRPITTILAGPRPTGEVMEAMLKVSRVLPVGTLLDDKSDVGLNNWLAILLPLSLPEPSDTMTDPIVSVRTKLKTVSPFAARILDSADNGTDAVQASLHSLLNQALRDEQGLP